MKAKQEAEQPAIIEGQQAESSNVQQGTGARRSKPKGAMGQVTQAKAPAGGVLISMAQQAREAGTAQPQRGRGRPKLADGEGRTKRVYLSLTPSTMQDLEYAAILLEKKRVSDVINSMVTYCLEQLEGDIAPLRKSVTKSRAHYQESQQ